MGLACNMLTTIGGTPQINTPGAVPKYPGHLPGGVRPQLTVGLVRLTKVVVLDTYMQIEYPEGGPIALFQGMTYSTIGAFYDALRDAFRQVPRGPSPAHASSPPSNPSASSPSTPSPTPKAPSRRSRSKGREPLNRRWRSTSETSWRTTTGSPRSITAGRWSRRPTTTGPTTAPRFPSRMCTPWPRCLRAGTPSRGRSTSFTRPS